LDKIKLYYFSGTGNSLSVARWIENKSISAKREIELFNIADCQLKESYDNSTVGFVSPTHGFNYPPIMLSFLFRFPRGKNSQAFLMNTRAGLKFGRVYIPGLSGIALLFAAIILICKGYKIIGMRPVDLPSNWISLHPGLSKKAINQLFARRKLEVEEFANKILSGRSDFRGLYDIIQDLLIGPIAVLYYLFGRFIFAKSFVASNKCNNCNHCIDNCPVEAIKTINGRPFWTYKCESCMQCMTQCPHQAIETAHGFVIGIMYLVYTFILVYLYNLLDLKRILEGLPSGLAGISSMVIDTVVTFIILIISYRIIHFLMRFSFIEKLIVYTSLTKIKFWRRYRAPKNFSK
jgi:Pyruvate/2-oxoacid:ferredoxin oxidoreductase delta subunit